MGQEQVADLINDIIDDYYMMNIEDFKLCFKRAKVGYYDRNGIFRIDANVILTWISKYMDERMNTADETSYNESQNHKDQSRTEPVHLKKAYNKFKF